MQWNSLNWNALDRLRAHFLAEEKVPGSYWTGREDLANYDFTYAQRIGWKWDAVLRELARLHWQPPDGNLLDWGCGSGIASRRIIEHIGQERVSELQLFDHSPAAVRFAQERAHEEFPNLNVRVASPEVARDGQPIGTLVLSHVLNELTDRDQGELLQLCHRAGTILWVEPGTHSVSRQLIAFREELRQEFRVIAPCPHQTSCGMLASGNEHHWCHFFADPPRGIMGDANWVKFAQRAGIDLRSLPYSYLVMERIGKAPPSPKPLFETADLARIIGRPRVYKSFARVFACQQCGLRELEAQKRDVSDFFKACKKERQDSLYRFEDKDGRIQQAAAGGD